MRTTATMNTNFVAGFVSAVILGLSASLMWGLYTMAEDIALFTQVGEWLFGPILSVVDLVIIGLVLFTVGYMVIAGPRP